MGKDQADQRLSGYGTSHSPVVGRRYQLLSRIGVGGMGVVFCAKDRLTGQIVALKRVILHHRMSDRRLGSTAGPQQRDNLGLEDTARAERVSTLPPAPTTNAGASFGSEKNAPHDRSDSSAHRQSLAQEFRSLASLHHPNVISVLDYGFDEQQQPYITMELLENAKNVRDFANGKALSVKLELLRQILVAVTYLHRREILHRDIKPSNVLVVPISEEPGFRVKLLDFGLAVAGRRTSVSANTVAGTLGYLAPELLRGESPSVASDLYAIGVLAFELLLERHPFPIEGTTESFLQQVRHTAPDLSQLRPDALIPLVASALAKTPWERPRTADLFLRDLMRFGGLEPHTESDAIRDSFLVAAPFTGRENEFCALATELAQAQRGMGAAWLLGGHSGIGKSRLLDEVRAMALIRGVVVVRGESQSHGQSPLQLWQQPIRMLCLGVTLSSEESSVLEGVVPDLAVLQEREELPGPKLVAQIELTQIAQVLLEVLRRQPQPVLLLLEDLQWADEESLCILRSIASQAHSLQLLMIGTFRSEEVPTLPDKLPELQVMLLERLSERSLQLLCTSMIGQQASSALSDLIERETAGNTFFLVELMRGLAEEAGSLESVGGHDLLTDIQRGGIMEVLRRRIERVPPRAMPLLRLAAVAGRQLDLPVIEQLLPHAEDLIQACASAGVLDMHEQQWRWSHEKLREFVRASLPAESRRELHAWLAETIELVYPDPAPHAMRLAHHHFEAGQYAQASEHFALAGSVAISAGSVLEGEQLLCRAIALQVQTDRPALLRIKTYRQLAFARFVLGKNQAADQAIQQAFALVGIHWPQGSAKLVLDTIGAFFDAQVRRTMATKPQVQTAQDKELWSELIKILPATEVYLSLASPTAAMFCWAHCLRMAEAVGDVMAHVQAAAFISNELSAVGLHLRGEHYLSRAEKMAQNSARPAAMVLIERARSGMALTAGRFEDAIVSAQYARKQPTTTLELTPTFRMLRLELVAQMMLGNFPAAWAIADELWALAERHDLPHKLSQAVGYRGVLWARQGESARALRFLEQATQPDSVREDSHHSLWFGGALALSYVRQGQLEKARTIADQHLAMIRHKRVDSLLSTLGMHSLADTYFDLMGSSACSTAHAHEALGTLLKQTAQQALRYRPAAPIWELSVGRMLQSEGKTALSILAYRRALQNARRLAMKYEEAMAHHRLAVVSQDVSPTAQLLLSQTPKAHRDAAQALFDTLGVHVP